MPRLSRPPLTRLPAFVVRPRLALDCSPPERPPWRRGYGSYCMKASCELRDAGGCFVGRVVGYDRYVGIQDTVERACRMTAQGFPGATCTNHRLVFLGDMMKGCAGEVFFVVDGNSRRLV